MAELFVSGCGAVTRDGIYSLFTKKEWDTTQQSLDSIRRDQALATPLPLFGKLNFPDKLAFSAASLALENIPTIPQEMSGISIAVPYGSLTTDMFFMESITCSLPSPAYFSATLPSSTIADIAIYFKLKGPDRVFCGGNSPVFDALGAAVDLLTLRKAKVVLFIAVWAIDPSNRVKLQQGDLLDDAAFALLLSASPLHTQSQPFVISMDAISTSSAPSTEYAFCSRVVDAVRGRNKQLIPFTNKGSENYFEVV